MFDIFDELKAAEEIVVTPSGTVYSPLLPDGKEIKLVLSLLKRTPSSDE